MTKHIEFGDFQTPSDLADQACRVLVELGLAPRGIVEPSAGLGNLLFAALRAFPSLETGIAVEVNPDYARQLDERIARERFVDVVRSREADTFTFDWDVALSALSSPLLVLTNPPWVTSATMGRLGGSNIPRKSNFLGLKGLDARTGKSNFDVSEWSLLNLVEIVCKRRADLGAFCKMSVARKVLTYIWQKGAPIIDASMFRIDAKRHFDASVEACFLLIRFGTPVGVERVCTVYSDLDLTSDSTTLSLVEGTLVSDAASQRRWQHLAGEERLRWRSGVKHDCSKVMELERTSDGYTNGFGDRVDIEEDFVFPLLKSSDLANGRVSEPRRFVVVTQRNVGAETARIAVTAPKTWHYLLEHAEKLDARRSSIYKGRPRFCVFGVGDYSFAPWKVAVSGLYKEPHFQLLRRWRDKPVMVDDTCYFLPLTHEGLAEVVLSLLQSSTAKDFFAAYLFLDAKRPLTRDVLARLDLFAIARELGREKELSRLWDQGSRIATPQFALFGD